MLPKREWLLRARPHAWVKWKDVFFSQGAERDKSKPLFPNPSELFRKWFNMCSQRKLQTTKEDCKFWQSLWEVIKHTANVNILRSWLELKCSAAQQWLKNEIYGLITANISFEANTNVLFFHFSLENIKQFKHEWSSFLIWLFSQIIKNLSIYKECNITVVEHAPRF